MALEAIGKAETDSPQDDVDNPKPYGSPEYRPMHNEDAEQKEQNGELDECRGRGIGL